MLGKTSRAAVRLTVIHQGFSERTIRRVLIVRIRPLATVIYGKRYLHCVRSGTVAMNEVHDQQHLRARIRLLLSTREIPRVISNISAKSMPCDACGKPIAEGSPQFEIGFSTLTFRLDGSCFDIWTEEMLREHPKYKSA